MSLSAVRRGRRRRAARALDARADALSRHVCVSRQRTDLTARRGSRAEPEPRGGQTIEIDAARASEDSPAAPPALLAPEAGQQLSALSEISPSRPHAPARHGQVRSRASQRPTLSRPPSRSRRADLPLRACHHSAHRTIVRGRAARLAQSSSSSRGSVPCRARRRSRRRPPRRSGRDHCPLRARQTRRRRARTRERAG